MTLIHNPASGDEDHDRETLLHVVESAGHEVAWHSTDEDGWESALEAAADLVVVVGGDGTVRRVFIRAAGKETPITLLPLGSANNIARALGFGDEDVARLVHGWERGEVRPFRLGLFEPEGERGHPFVESAGGGIFADVLVRDEERPEDATGEDSVQLGLELLREAVGGAPCVPWEVEIDGEDRSGELLAVEAMSIGVTGPRVPLAPEAEPGDEQLDVVLVGEPERAVLAGYVEARLAGRDVAPPGLPVFRARRVFLQPPHGAVLRLDDEIFGAGQEQPWSGRAEVTVESALQILVPLP